MDGINTHMVGSGPVNFDFVSHPPAPEPTIGSSIKGLGSTYGNLGGTKINKTRMAATVLVSGMLTVGGLRSDSKAESKKLLTGAGVLALLGSLYSMS